MSTLLLTLALAAPPAWQVTPNTPAYQVTIRDDYPDFHARVLRREVGRPLVAYVGVPKPAGLEGVELRTEYLPVGVWYCWRTAAGKLMYDAMPPAEVAAPRPFGPASDSIRPTSVRIVERLNTGSLVTTGTERTGTSVPVVRLSGFTSGCSA